VLVERVAVLAVAAAHLGTVLLVPVALAVLVTAK
jgi:hypothetical protein